MTTGIEELIEFLKILEKRLGRSSYELKLIADYAERMKEKDQIMTKTLVKHCIIEALLTCDEPRGGSLNKYIDEIYNIVVKTIKI